MTWTPLVRAFIYLFGTEVNRDKKNKQIISTQAQEPLESDNAHSAVQTGPCPSFQFIDFLFS